MSEITAEQKFACPACGGESVWNAARQKMVCPFCGTESPVTLTPGGPLIEHDLVTALTDTVKGVYLPYWTFDAHVEADWTAEAGYYYYTTETYVENGQTRTRDVRNIRWESAAGHVSTFFDDDLVCASVGVHPNLVRGIEPFPTHDVKPYDAGFVSGWIVERYQIDLIGAAQRARAAM